MTHAPHASLSHSDIDSHAESRTPLQAEPRTPRADVRRNRALLLAAAREVFAEHGLDAGMDAIAARAGVGTATAYRHFANKYDMANAIFDDVVNAIVADAGQVQVRPDPWGTLVRTLELTLTEQGCNRAVREMILAENQADWSHHDTLLAPVRTAVESAKQAGVLRDDIDVTDVTVILIMLSSLSDQLSDTAPQIWRRYLPALLDGIRADSAPLPGKPLTEHRLRAAQTRGLLRYQ